MGKVYDRSQKKSARTERKRRRNLGPHEWDGFQGRGQRALEYWWDLPDRKKSSKPSKLKRAGKADPFRRGKKVVDKIPGFGIF